MTYLFSAARVHDHSHGVISAIQFCNNPKIQTTLMQCMIVSSVQEDGALATTVKSTRSHFFAQDTRNMGPSWAQDGPSWGHAEVKFGQVESKNRSKIY